MQNLIFHGTLRLGRVFMTTILEKEHDGEAVSFTTFGQVRQDALDYWREKTFRNQHYTESGLPIDFYSGIFECDWQERAQTDCSPDNLEENEFYHVSVFCSLGGFGSIISDILLQEHLDVLDFSDPTSQDAAKLFRHYSILLNAFVNLLADIEKVADSFLPNAKKQKQVRNALSPNLDKFMEFPNTYCKHGYGKPHAIHKNDHHLPRLFLDDSQVDTKLEDYGSLIDLEKTYQYKAVKDDKDEFFKVHQPQAILMPKIKFVIDIAVECYQSLDNLFINDNIEFKNLCENFGTVMRHEFDPEYDEILEVS